MCKIEKYEGNRPNYYSGHQGHDLDVIPKKCLKNTVKLRENTEGWWQSDIHQHSPSPGSQLCWSWWSQLIPAPTQLRPGWRSGSSGPHEGQTNIRTNSMHTPQRKTPCQESNHRPYCYEATLRLTANHCLTPLFHFNSLKLSCLFSCHYSRGRHSHINWTCVCLLHWHRDRQRDLERTSADDRHNQTNRSDDGGTIPTLHFTCRETHSDVNYCMSVYR